jgi:hypothetical protein
MEAYLKEININKIGLLNFFCDKKLDDEPDRKGL